MKNRKLFVLLAVCLLAIGGYVLFINKTYSADEAIENAEYERGPNHGKLFRDGDFGVEITIFEDGVPPQYRVYAYDGDTLIAPEEVKLTINLTRLDGEVNNFQFTPEGNYLKGDGVVTEPHSFDVEVEATYEEETHRWNFASYEGRTTIEDAAAEAAGVELEKAGPATIRETVSLNGRIMLNRNSTANVQARFPGVIREVLVEQGQSVEKGAVLARVESNDSLQVYAVTAPIAGVVLTRNAGIGEVAGDKPLFVVTDLTNVWAELHVFPKDVVRVASGQKAIIKGTDGAMVGEGGISALLPMAETATQTVVARIPLDNPEGKWRTGMTITGTVVVAEHEVPLAVKTEGLQRFRDFTVVFAKVGEAYEVRMLELGRTDDEYVEVLEGIKPDQAYVAKNSFLIKADIEKSGASHDH